MPELEKTNNALALLLTVGVYGATVLNGLKTEMGSLCFMLKYSSMTFSVKVSDIICEDYIA